MLAYDFLRRNRQSEDSTLAKPGGRLSYGVVHSKRHYPIFVAVTIDKDESHVYRLMSRKKRMTTYGMGQELSWRLQCRDCNQNSSEVDGTVKHSMRQNGKRCDGSGDKQKRAARWAIRQWAAVRANEEAKGDYFTQEDLHKWMEVAGYIPKIPNKEKYEALRMFVTYLEAKPDHLCKLLERTKQGEEVVRHTNKLKAWRKRVDMHVPAIQADSEIQPPTPSPLADNSIPPQEMATQEGPAFVDVSTELDSDVDVGVVDNSKVGDTPRLFKPVAELDIVEREITSIKSRFEDRTRRIQELTSELKSELESLKKQLDLSGNCTERDPLEISQSEMEELSQLYNGDDCGCSLSAKRSLDHAFTEDTEGPPVKRNLIQCCHNMDCETSKLDFSQVIFID